MLYALVHFTRDLSQVRSCLKNVLSIGDHSAKLFVPKRVQLISDMPQSAIKVTNGHSIIKEAYMDNDHFATLALHAGQEPSQWNSKAVVPPISMATTFQQEAPGKHAGYEYSRSGNPTRDCLEKCLAALESGKHATCFASGLAATTSVTYLLNSGDHLISCDDVYGGTNRFFRTCASKMGIETTFVDATDPAKVAAELRNNTKMIWIETPSNPTMKLIDIRAIVEIAASQPNVLVVVDNTFMSSYFQKPLTMGADIVLHSLTKYMNGHSDVVMGAAVTNSVNLDEKLRYYQNALGAVPSPFDCFLVNRGLKTLHLRMERHMSNGLAVAKYLESHPMIEKVVHPGLPSHPQHKLALKQCTGFSGMVSIYLKGGLMEAQEFLKKLNVFTLAESLGSVESLIELPVVMTHASVPAEQRVELGITDSLVRLSVGLESEQDLIDDLSQALIHVQKLLKQNN